MPDPNPFDSYARRLSGASDKAARDRDDARETAERTGGDPFDSFTGRLDEALNRPGTTEIQPGPVERDGVIHEVWPSPSAARAVLSRSTREGANSNTLDRPIVIAGILLWPSWAAPPVDAPAARRGQTGTVENHWEFTRGELDMSLANPAWNPADGFAEADYAYDRQHAGTPLPNVDVDLYRSDACEIDFDDYEQLDEYYKEEWNRVEQVKSLLIKFLAVDVVDDGDCIGPGELFFEGRVGDESTGETLQMTVNSGATQVPLRWETGRGVIEVDVLNRREPLMIRLLGRDQDCVSSERIGWAEREIVWPWPTQRMTFRGAGRDLLLHFEIEPIMATARDRATGKQRCAEEDKREPIVERIDRARIASTRTNSDGVFHFRAIPAGEYFLFLRGRFSFIENPHPGGQPVPMPGGEQHNGVVVRDLADLHAAHRLHLRVRVNPGGEVEFLTDDTGGQRRFNVVKDRPPHALAPFSAEIAADQSEVAPSRRPPASSRRGSSERFDYVSALNRRIPYRFYALPLVVESNRGQFRACVQEISRAFKVPTADAERAIRSTAVLDVKALRRWELADDAFDSWKHTPPAIRPGSVTTKLLQHTLLLTGAPGAEIRTMAFDHVYWDFADRTAVDKTAGRFVPLGNPGFFTDANNLYQRATKIKDTYGCFAMRLQPTELDGRDVGELKIRLSLWGSDTEPVVLSDRAARNDDFDEPVAHALVRFKFYFFYGLAPRNNSLIRLVLPAQPGAGAAPARPERYIITSIVDKMAYDALDSVVPPTQLDDVASRGRGAAMPGPAYNTGRDPQLTVKGYGRLAAYGAEIARHRLSIARMVTLNIHVHSSFRTLAHNRDVYMHLPANNTLRWRVGTAGPALNVVHNSSGINNLIAGVAGRDGTNHAAQDQVTNADVIWDAPRGTYVNGNGGNMGNAADFSRHTFGQALDFCLSPTTGVHRSNRAVEVPRDCHAMVRFGASLQIGAAPNHRAGRFWIEGNEANRAPTWVHLDAGDMRWPPAPAAPVFRDEFVLTNHDLDGPRWEDNLIVRGRVTQGGAARLGARVELRKAATVVTFTYANEDGRYSLRVMHGDVQAAYVVVAMYPSTFAGDSWHPSPYPYQLPAAGTPTVRATVRPIAFNRSGEELDNVDLQVPPAP